MKCPHCTARLDSIGALWRDRRERPLRGAAKTAYYLAIAVVAVFGIAIVLAVAACGTDPHGGDDDDTVTVDGPPRVPVTMDVTPNCETFVREERIGAVVRMRQTYRYATVASVGPETVFAVEQCGVTYRPPRTACPAGSVCTGSFGPAGADCFRSYRGGSFIDGKLVVFCGQLVESFNDLGVTVASSGLDYASVKVVTY